MPKNSLRSSTFQARNRNSTADYPQKSFLVSSCHNGASLSLQKKSLADNLNRQAPEAPSICRAHNPCRWTFGQEPLFPRHTTRSLLKNSGVRCETLERMLRKPKRLQHPSSAQDGNGYKTKIQHLLQHILDGMKRSW
jgi:hypothetical protein